MYTIFCSIASGSLSEIGINLGPGDYWVGDPGFVLDTSDLKIACDMCLCVLDDAAFSGKRAVLVRLGNGELASRYDQFGTEIDLSLTGFFGVIPVEMISDPCGEEQSGAIIHAQQELAIQCSDAFRVLRIVNGENTNIVINTNAPQDMGNGHDQPGADDVQMPP